MTARIEKPRTFAPVLPPDQRGPVLVVDDVAADRALTARLLRGWGHDVLEADRADLALDLCREMRIDMVVADWMMPGLDGPDFCRAYRALERDVPGYVILFTARHDGDTLTHGLAAGADDILHKSADPAELRARVLAGQRAVAAQRTLAARNRLLRRALDDAARAHAALDGDLREAQALQQALVPRRSAQVSWGDITLLFRPSGRVGGDLVGYRHVGGDRFGVFALDVAGHGVASALVMARVAAHLTPVAAERNIALQSGDAAAGLVSPAEVCRRLNRILLEDVGSHHYLTMIFADCDLATGHCVLAQAGHPSPLVQRRCGAVEFPASFGMPVGLIEDAEYSEFTVDLEPGDRLLMYSDGVTECADPSGKLLDDDGLVRAATDLAGRRGADFTLGLEAWLSSYQRGKPFADDISAALVERAPTPNT